MNTAYISLSSNQDQPENQLKTAIKLLNCTIIKQSKIYKTEPWGLKDQDWYLNQILIIQTELNAYELLHKLQTIETQMGRIRKIKYGPRIIDLDILYFNTEIINEPNLQIPHPKISERNFVLIPLTEIDPSFIDPIHNISVLNLLKQCKDESLVIPY